MSHHLPWHVDMLGNVLSALVLGLVWLGCYGPQQTHTHTLILCIYAQLIVGEFSNLSSEHKELHFGLDKLMEGSGRGWREKKKQVRVV